MKHLPLTSCVLLVALWTLGSGTPSAWAAAGPATITTQPASQTIYLGDPVTFTVGVDGTEPFTYQWYRNGQLIGGATASSYTIPVTAAGDNGASFQVAVTNALGGAISDSAELRIDPGILSTNVVTLLPFNASWRYNQAGTDLGTTWRDVAYNDQVAGWNSGPGVFDAKTTQRPTIGGQTVGTQLVGGNPLGSANYPTLYFRTRFNYDTAAVVSVSLEADVLVDDAVLLYLNGQGWLGTEGLNFGAVYSDWSTFTVGDASVATYPAPTTALVPGTNLIAAEVHNVNATSSDITFGLQLRARIVTRVRDTQAPAATYIPAPNSTLRSLAQIEVRFNESVQGVDAADLLINGAPATNLLILGPDQYLFRFPATPTGQVAVAWAPSHAITDLSANANAFAGGSFTYIVDPNANFSDVRINEFLAANTSNSGLRDEDGSLQDWIELHNGGSTGVDLAGWYLTDDAFNLTKWQFPSVTLPAGGYLVVFASEKNRRVPGAPLHTNFKLERNGEFLALVLPDGTNIVSAFSPAYPAQFENISYGRDRIDPSVLAYFSTPTPGALNSATAAGLGVGPAIRYSRASGTFRTPFSVELSLEPVPSATNFVIRYYLVTNATTAAATDVPSASSPLYTGPIPVTASTQIRARAYPTTTGFYPGPASSETYLQIDAAAAAFTSDLPVVLFYNFGGGIPGATFTSAGVVGVFMAWDTNNPTGLTSLTNRPVLVTRAGSHIRGSSTESYDKRNLAIETWTEVNREDKDVEVLGMPADSDWVLYAPNQFDRNYLHNPVAMELGRQMGHYASRTRLAEFFFNTIGGAITYPGGPGTTHSGYAGVYVVMEKIKQNQARLDIARLDAADTNATTITGGYVMKIDRANDADDVNNFTPGAWPTGRFPWITGNHANWNTQPIIFHDPDGLTIGTRPTQRTWFINYIAAFEAALTATTWTNRDTGYRAYIDEDQWIENHMLNVFPFNVDGYRLSGYFYKERDEPGRPLSGKLKQGPLWDYDRSQGTGSVDPRPFNPRQWKRQIGGDQGTDLFGNNDNTTGTRLGVRWWWQMFNDPDFWQRWVDRWQDMREGGIWSTTNVTSLIDRLANQVRQAAPRNAARWPSGNSIGTPTAGTVSADGYTYNFPGTYQGEIDFLKKWWTDRLDFVETNFLRRPSLSQPSGLVAPGAVITVTVTNVRAGTVTYYTLDGTDPRLPGGAINPAALSNSTSSFTVTINQNTRLFLRSRNSSHANLTNASLTAVGGNPPLSTPWSGARVETYYTALPPLRISELMYNPFVPPGNTNEPGNFEYVELVNVSGGPLSLIGFRFTNGIEFQFTATNAVTSLAPGGRVLVVKNRSAFLSRYPTLASLVAGEYLGSLDNAGERIALIGPLWEPVHNFRYEPDWQPITDGYGLSLVPVDENAPANSWTNAAQWRASAYNGGSPGAADPAPTAVLPVVVNEIVPSASTSVDAVELFNPNPVPVDIGHWYLTDNRNQPQKYRIPADTVIPANGYRVFYETNSFNAPGVTNIYGTGGFAFSANGEEVYLFSGDAAGRLTGYFQGFDFGPAAVDVSFGRYTNSVGRVMEVALSAVTLGAANAAPLVGPVVISEFMFQPPTLMVDGVPTENYRDEYVELRNISGAAVPLYASNYPALTWRLEKAVEYSFPPNTILPAGGRLVVVSFNPALEPSALSAFRSRYGVAQNVAIYGPYDGRLDNAGERLELRRPGTVNPGTGAAPLILADRVDYEGTNAPWNAGRGTGASMQRMVLANFGNDPANWLAGSANPGQDRVAGDPPSILTQPASQAVVEEAPASFSVVAGGTGPFTYQWYFNDQPIDGAVSTTLVLPRVLPPQAGNYKVLVLSGNGAIFSSNALLTVLPLPVITSQPDELIKAPLGTNLTLAVTVTGTGPISYQWQFNSNNLSGQTGSTLALNNVQLEQHGFYRCVVTDTVGSRTSRDSWVFVLVRPTLTQQPYPTNQVVLVGGDIHLAAEATGAPPLLCRWRRTGNTNVAVESGLALTLSGVGLTEAGFYDVVITNLAGASSPSVSSRAYVVVVAPPASQGVMSGANVTFRSVVRFSGLATNRFWWWHNGTTVVGEGTNILTAANPVSYTNDLVLTGVTAGQAGTYTLVVSNVVAAGSGGVTNFVPAVNSASFDLIVDDTTAPIITCPADLEVNTDPGLCTANPAFTPTVSDNVGVAGMSCLPAGPYPLGTTVVTCRAWDVSGNTNSCAFTIAVSDAQPPVFNGCPEPQTATAGGSGLAPMPDFRIGVTATDNCPGTPGITQSPPVGAPVGGGTNVVTLTATDVAGNTATCLTAFIVEVPVSEIRLSIELVGTTAVIRWPDTPPVVWTLEEATDLTPPGDWQTSALTPAKVNSHWEAVAPIATGTNKFFRLKQP